MSRSRQTNLLLFLFVAMIVSILTLNDIQTGRFTLNNNNWQRNTAFSSKRRSIEIRNAIQYTELPPFIDEIKSPTSDIIIDTISMGNKGNITNGKLMLQSQKETWVKATPGARWFFAATEDICFPECLAQNVSSQEREFVCNLEQQDSVNPKGDRPLFWSGEIMRSQSERSQGWWCAQPRTARALQILIDVYQSPMMNGTVGFPDWLYIVDDDSWLSPYFFPLVLRRAPAKSNSPMALSPTLLTKFPPSIHYGGVGLAINRAMLQSFARPLFCHSKKESALPCDRLKEAGYLSRFKDGMTLIDFMVNLLDQRVSCLHSDWWQGLLIWLSGYQIGTTECPECLDVSKGSRFGLHLRGSCGPQMLSCHKMTHLRMPEMTENAIKCSETGFKAFVPCQQIMSFGATPK